MKTETALVKAEAPSLELARLAAMGHLAKAAQTLVDGYTRSDGTEVRQHRRDTGAKPAQPTAEQDTELAARHETSARRLGPNHSRYGQHTEMAALHLAASRHAYRAADDSLDAPTRAAAAEARAHLKKLLAEKARTLNADRAKASGEATMTKAKPALLVRRTTKAPTAPKVRSSDCTALLAEMAWAQRQPAAVGAIA